jgi:predicted nucleotidyltransferase
MTGQQVSKEEQIRAFGKRHHIRTLSIPEAALGDAPPSEGAVEVLVAFEPDYLPGLMHLAAMQQELGEILGCHIAIQTAPDLGRYVRQRHLDLEEGPYAKGLRGPWKYRL